MDDLDFFIKCNMDTVYYLSWSTGTLFNKYLDLSQDILKPCTSYYI